MSSAALHAGITPNTYPQHFPAASLGPQKCWSLSLGMQRNFLGSLSLLNCTEAWGKLHSHVSAAQSLVKKNGGLSPWLLQRKVPSCCMRPAAAEHLSPRWVLGLPGRGSTSAPLLSLSEPQLTMLAL